MQTMKFGKLIHCLIEYLWQIFFWKNHTENLVEKLVPRKMLIYQERKELLTFLSTFKF